VRIKPLYKAAVALMMGCAYFPLVAALASATPQVTVDELLDRALQESPVAKEIESKIASQRALGLQAGALENPTVDAEVRIPTSYAADRGSDEIAVSLSQPVRVSDLGVRQRVNRLVQAAASQDEKIELLAFSQKVKLGYCKVWALSRRETELKSYLETAGRVERAIGKAAAAGLMGTGEGLLFKAEALKARYELAALSADVKRARADLTKLVGFSVQGELVRPSLAGLPSAQNLGSLEGVLPAESRAQLALRLAREQQRQAELDAFPKLSPRLGYERTNDKTDFLGIGVSFELPFFDRGQGERLARGAEARAAEKTAAYFAGPGYREEVSALRASVESAAALVEGYEKEILPTLREALRLEEQLFSSGNGTPSRLWQVLRELSAAQSEAVERLVRVYVDRVELTILTGTDF
jgi:outer membrane protein TolC